MTEQCYKCEVDGHRSNVWAESSFDAARYLAEDELESGKCQITVKVKGQGEYWITKA